MTIFDILNSILYTKKKLDLNLEDENVIGGPFMLNRWISMYSKELCVFVNNTLNKVYPLEDKNSLYNFYYNFLPKIKFKKIAYIKKTKKDEDDIPALKREFLSQRELSMYVDLLTK